MLNLLLLAASTSCIGDEFESIFSQINRFILEKEKRSSLNLKDSIDSATKINEALPRLNPSDMFMFRDQFIDIVHNFDIETLDLAGLLDRIGTNDAPVAVIINRIGHFKAYVENSLKWYSFLEKLRDDYNLQKTERLPHDFASNIIENAFVYDENTTELAKTFDFAKSISQLDPHQYKDIQDAYKSIQDVDLNANKLNLLRTVWIQSRQPVQMECQNDTMVVFGYNVVMGDVVANDCFKTAPHLEVFAFNKVFFDTDVRKHSFDMAVVAPIWETIGSDHFAGLLYFDGEFGAQPAFAVDSVRYPEQGKPGATGQPGGWGGQFIAYGRSFYGRPIHVHLQGGLGGAGQNGGNG